MDRCSDIRRALNLKCATLGIPSNGIFELTPRCNLRCKMCYVRLDPEQMAAIGQEYTAAQWLDMGRQVRDAGTVFLLLTGGEPTMRSDFCEIFQGLEEMGFSIAINTNGTHLTPQIRELWHRLPPLQVNITLYGTCREDYEALCGNPGAFDAVVDALDWLQREGILVHLNTTIVPTNRHKFLEVEQFAKNRGLELRLTTYCFPPNRRDHSCFERLSPEEAAELIVQDTYFREGAVSIKAKARDLDIAPLQRACDLDLGEPMQLPCRQKSVLDHLEWQYVPLRHADPARHPSFPAGLRRRLGGAEGRLPAHPPVRRLCGVPGAPLLHELRRRHLLRNRPVRRQTGIHVPAEQSLPAKAAGTGRITITVGEGLNPPFHIMNNEVALLMNNCGIPAQTIKSPMKPSQRRFHGVSI